MSNNLPQKRHPDSAQSIETVDHSYQEIVNGFEALDELSKSDPQVAEIILSQNSHLAQIYAEYRSAIAKTDTMNGTIEVKNATIKKLTSDIESLEHIIAMTTSVVVTPREVERRKDKKRGERYTENFKQVMKTAQQNGRH